LQDDIFIESMKRLKPAKQSIADIHSRTSVAALAPCPMDRKETITLVRMERWDANLLANAHQRHKG
jgi:hypothetical protein